MTNLPFCLATITWTLLARCSWGVSNLKICLRRSWYRDRREGPYLCLHLYLKAPSDVTALAASARASADRGGIHVFCCCGGQRFRAIGKGERGAILPKIFSQNYLLC